MVKSTLWKCGEEYKVHVRSGLSTRLKKVLKDEPITFYYKNLKLVAVDFIFSIKEKEKVQQFIKSNRTKKK